MLYYNKHTTKTLYYWQLTKKFGFTDRSKNEYRVKYPNVSTLSNFHCLERAMRPELLEIVRYCCQYICLAACCRILDSMCQGNFLNEKWKTKKSAHITCLWFNVSTGVLSMWALVVTLENIITHWQWHWHWVPVLSNIKTATGCVSNRRSCNFELVFAGTVVNN